MEFNSLPKQIATTDKHLNLPKILEKDFSYQTGKVLSSMNSEPLAREFFAKNIHRNLGDPALFSGTKEIESYVITILGKLVNLPPTGTGVIISGGSEANITALWSIRNRRFPNFLELNYAPEIIAPRSVHISIDKACDLLGLKLIKINLNSEYKIDIHEAKKTISDKTLAFVGVAGTTAIGSIDPLKEINDICLKYNLDFHVDAAFGGLIIPFLGDRQKYNLSFDLKALSTMTIDIHKMGRVAPGGGGLLWRDTSFPSAIEFKLPYLPGIPKQKTLTGTRSGASAISFAFLWQKFHFEGYQKSVLQCIENTLFLENELRKRGFLIPVKPTLNILGIKSPFDSPLTVNYIHDVLWKQGWTTSIVDDFLRFVIMPQTKHRHIVSLIALFDSLMKEQ